MKTDHIRVKKYQIQNKMTLKMFKPWWQNWQNKHRGIPLREKCPNTEFFWSLFSCILSKCGKIRTRKTQYLCSFYAAL